MTKLGCGIIIFFLSLQGCAVFDSDNYKSHKEMYIAHDNTQQKTASDKALAIASIANNTEFKTPVEAALFKVIAVQSIERIVYSPFKQKAPATGWGVLDKMAGGLPSAIIGLTSYGVAKKAMQYGGSTYTIEAGSVNDSFSRNDVSIVGSDNGLSTSMLERTEIEGE